MKSRVKKTIPLDEFIRRGDHDHPLYDINGSLATIPGLIRRISHLERLVPLVDLAVMDGVSGPLVKHFDEDWLRDGWGWGDDPEREREALIREGVLEGLQAALDRGTRPWIVVQAVRDLPRLQVVVDHSDVQTTIVLQMPARPREAKT